jgi:hypothetical protein
MHDGGLKTEYKVAIKLSWSKGDNYNNISTMVNGYAHTI